MSVLFEHDTTQKTRRAIIVTSVTTIVLHYVQLGSNELEIFKLNIIVDKENIVIFLKFGLAYLVYMYVVYEFGGYWTERTKRLLESIRGDYFTSSKGQGMIEEESHAEAIEREFNEKENERILRISSVLKSMRDYFPVFFFAFLVFTDAHEALIGRHITQQVAFQIDQPPLEVDQ